MKFILLPLACLLLLGCTSQPTAKEELFKNTKKLVVDGHKSLYENGAFHIPNTSISLIPPGPSAGEFAAELFGIRAKQSFLESIQNAADSVQIISIGTEKTYDFSQGVYEGGNDFANTVTEFSRPGGMLLMKRSIDDAKYISGQSWEAAKSSAQFLWHTGDDITDASINSASSMSSNGQSASSKLFSASIDSGKKIGSTMLDLSEKTFKYGGNEFIKGYAALPDKASQRGAAMSPTPSWHRYAASAEKANAWRASSSDSMAFFVKDAATNYFENVGNSFSKSKEALSKTENTGTLAVLKSLGWALHGLAWEGLIKPTAKITAGSIGYVAVNTVVYPVMLVGHSTISLAEVAVKVTWNTGAMAYEFVAPTAKAALAGILGTVEATGGVIAGGAVMTAGTAASGATLITSQAAAATIATVGGITGQTVKYIGVPLAASGIAVGGTAVGVTVGTAEATMGVTTLATGEAISLGSKATSTVVAGTTLVTGTVASGVGGTAYGIYELSKAVIVPMGYTLSSGIVLSYGSISQLAAHCVLAVSDAAYLVLSMEGPVDAPKWVIYSVQDVFNMGNDLPGGTVLDLENMQNKGEVFKRLPVSENEMNAVIENIPRDLKTINI
jgi:hypothetical protein